MSIRSIGLAAAVLAGLLSNGVARGDVIYDFSGILDSGAPVTGVLSLSDAYTPGAPLAESSGTGGGVFISYTQSISGFADLTLTSADYTLVAGTAADPFFGQIAAGDGPLPSVPGVASLADVFVADSTGSLGLNDYVDPGGLFVAVNSAFVSGTEGTWTLRSVPEPASLTLLGLSLAGIGFVRRRC